MCLLPTQHALFWEANPICQSIEEHKMNLQHLGWKKKEIPQV